MFPVALAEIPVNTRWKHNTMPVWNGDRIGALASKARMNERMNERANRGGNAETKGKRAFACGVSELLHTVIRTQKVVWGISTYGS